MNIAVVWNVWSNYEDVKIASEILKLENRRTGVFDAVHTMAQGGYPDPPSDEQRSYLDEFQRVEIDENWKPIRKHMKYKGVYRVLEGIKNAYVFGAKKQVDYVVVTNGDAWMLDASKLRRLLERPGVQAAAVSSRVGPTTALYNNFGGFVPFFDDHFVIINVEVCKRLGVFDYSRPQAYDSAFYTFGGIHYLLWVLYNEIVPSGFLHRYTTMSDCVNHFGERGGFSLLPWQYQPSFGFLHANCEQLPELHPLRAAQLRLNGLDRYEFARRYCDQHDKSRRPIGTSRKGFVYFKQSLREKVTYALLHLFRNARNDLRQVGSARRLAELRKSTGVVSGSMFDPARHYRRYRFVHRMDTTQRRI